jgi:hypothetical protein
MIASAIHSLTDRDLAVLAALLALGFFCAGMAIGLWRSNRKDIAIYREGQFSGFNAAKAKYSVPPSDMLPLLHRPRVAPFAGREPPT